MRIKAVLFDFDGTLYSQPVLRAFMILHIGFSYLKKPSATKQAAKVLMNFRKAHELIREKNTQNEDLLGEQIRIASELSGTDTEFTKIIIDDWFFNAPLRFFAVCRRLGLKALFKWLKENNYKTGIFSDYPAELKTEALKINEYVDIYVSSCDSDVGCLKPDAKGFLKAAKLMNLEPGEILYVGDRGDVDSIGAENAGMKSLLVGYKNLLSNKSLFSKSVKNALKKFNSGASI